MFARATPSALATLAPMTAAPLTPIEIGLTAAIVTVEDEEPAILVAGDGATGEPRAGLPFGAFDPLTHRTFEIGLRAWVEAQTGLAVGYVEQLYTFGDRGRHARPGDTGAHVVSIGYLALTRVPENRAAARARPPRARALMLRARRQPMGRGEGARPLRAHLRGRPGRGSAPRRPRSRAGAANHAPAGRAHALRSPPHPRHRDRAAARQAQIPSRHIRADGARVHPHRAAAHGGGDFGPPPAQAELPPLG